MKTKLLLLISVGGMCVALSSCQKDTLYSCDPIVNELVQQNIDQYGQISNREWSGISNKELKTAIFRSFLPDKKQQFISSRLDSIAKRSKWNSEEIKHILSVKQFINSNPELLSVGWESSNKELKDKYDLFQYKWVDYAKSSLNWTDETIFLVGFCLDEVECNDNILSLALVPINNDYNMPFTKTRSEDRGRPRCFCHSNFNYCKAGDPYMWFMTCKKGYWNCESTSFGCQLMLLGSCDGICYSSVSY